MNLFILAGLLAAIGAMPARAESTATYDVGIKYADLDFRGNRQQAMEYDGKLYGVPHGDVSVSNTGERGLLDLTVKDIGSREEDVKFNLDYKSTLKVSGSWAALHHRMNPMRHGQIVNGVWRPNNIGLTTGAQRFTTIVGDPVNFIDNRESLDYKIKRTEAELNIALYAPTDSARWIAAQFWSAEKFGTKYSQTATNNVGPGNVDNTMTFLTLGLGTSIKESAAVALDLIRTKFEDNAAEFKVLPANVVPLLPRWSDHEMTAGELRWRFDPTKKLSLTGALTGRQRHNLINQYKMNVGVAAVNAAYRVSDKLTLSGKVYSRYHEIDENPGFIGFNSSGRTGNTHEFDKLQVKSEFIANWRPVEKVRTQASYKLEMIHRRDAPSQEYTLDTTYADGLVIPGNVHANNVANDETKHTLNLKGTVELPLDAEFEAGYKKLYANRPAFVNSPDRADDATAQFHMPLPGHVEFMMGADYTKESNSKAYVSYHMMRNAYYTGLDWEHNNKMFVGLDGSYETLRYNIDEYYGGVYNVIGTVTPPGNVNLPHEGGALDHQRNTTAGLHGRLVCPKGFTVFGNGSYTWSIVQNPVHFGWVAAQAAAAFTPAGTFIGDIQPSEIRTSRGTLGMEYTPEKFKNLTARASYTIVDWVDVTDSYNSGRASVASVGASMKF